MRVIVRALPWMLAVLGLAIPLIGSAFGLWMPIGAWLVVLAVAWAVTRRIEATRESRVAVALALLPILFILGWEGGWWLIPADLAWLAIGLRTPAAGAEIGRDATV